MLITYVLALALSGVLVTRHRYAMLEGWWRACQSHIGHVLQGVGDGAGGKAELVTADYRGEAVLGSYFNEIQFLHGRKVRGGPHRDLDVVPLEALGLGDLRGNVPIGEQCAGTEQRVVPEEPPVRSGLRPALPDGGSLGRRALGGRRDVVWPLPPVPLSGLFIARWLYSAKIPRSL